MTEIKEYIAKYESLLPTGEGLSAVEAERRAGEFLSVMATIVNWRHLLAQDKIRLMSVQTAVYAEQMAAGTAKTVTENKLAAEASQAYTKSREDFESIENDLNYLKAYYEIFNNAHIFYRSVAKGNEF